MLETKIKITFTEPILGTASSDPDIHDRFIASKAPDAKSRSEELGDMIATEGLDVAIERGMTVFPKDEVTGVPFYWDYQVKGFFKDACSMLKRCKGTKSEKMKAYKKVIDGTIFVAERRIPLIMPEGGEIEVNQRPLRAQTAQGERVSLASSEMLPAGTTMELTIQCMNPSDWDYVAEWLDYGRMRGMGQWRNASYGRFEWEEVGD